MLAWNASHEGRMSCLHAMVIADETHPSARRGDVAAPLVRKLRFDVRAGLRAARAACGACKSAGFDTAALMRNEWLVCLLPTCHD